MFCTVSRQLSPLQAVSPIPLPGITLANFASRHATEWFHISREKLCYQSQFLPPSQVAITMDYRHQGRVRLCHIMGMLLVIDRVCRF